MSENNKTYRIKTNVGSGDENYINVKLDQDYDSFQILSLTLKGADTYRLHNANYGVIVGRVLANENFGVPNAKVSVFIEADTENMSLSEFDLYPYTKTSTTNRNGVRYNLLPNEKIDDCHQPVGTFPTKSYLLDNDDLIEIFDGYYIYTTRTNNAGDYMICGVPTGNHELHMDLDLSDCGILSQRPRDFVYKGYTMEQFENPNMFKTGTTLSSLSQIFSQNQSVNVIPFWGNDNGEEIGITRADIFVSFTFEPTCVFMGSVVTDNTSNGISKKCVPSNNMGAMDELTTGKGTIEIIRKTPGGNIERIEVKGNQVIDGNGVWCYQIPMNLDYMMTDEYGNMVPTDDPSKGIPTRTRVRFRLALEDFGGNTDNFYKSKALIPNNPPISAHGNVDYNFGSETQEESFRDLYWNNVYTVKSYIPRFQKSLLKIKNWRTERFSGIKHCNIYGNNNPIPYNNIRIKLPLMFRIMCAILKNFIRMAYLLNKLIYRLDKALTRIAGYIIVISNKDILQMSKSFRYVLIGEKLCEDLDGWYFAPGANTKLERDNPPVDIIIGAKRRNKDDDFFLLQHTYDTISDKEEMEGLDDNTSVDTQNQNDDGNDGICLTTDTDYLVSCLEMQLAQQHKVIQFDFYNDWINGLIYLPNWKRIVKTKRTFMFWTWKRKKIKVKGCMNANGAGTAKSRYLVQQCALKYKGSEGKPFTEVTSTLGCSEKLSGRLLGKKITNAIGQATIQEQKCHKATGMQMKQIFGKKNGLVTEVKTMRNQYVYYLKPCEWEGDMNYGKRVLLFATDIVLLGSLNDCDDNGIPQAFKHLQSSSYKLPSSIAQTTMDDDSYIFTTTGATICKKQSQTTKFSGNGKDGGIRRQYTTFNGTTKAYSVNSPSEQINYGAYDDPIAVTEAAGISWNYTGPGQDILGIGEQSETLFPNLNKFDAISDDLLKQKYLYYPGGHFLGLSCNNSQTNIKSCINLKRICEVGTTMSERHEIVRGINEQNGEIQYRYLVPTGFIAQDEVNDAAFRTMFATMNHNTLLAKGVDENTGYPAYKFKFMRPNGFDGTFSKYAYLDKTPYNHVAPDVVDETGILDKLFAINGWAKPDDYDPEESGNTETRTIEDVSKDYYMFRMGLNDLKVRSQIEKFLITNGNAEGMIPQYENSFYFYFGLKDGATALDEFKRQFFSECEKRSLITGTQIKAKTDIDICNLRGTIKLTIDGMIPSYLVSIKDNKQDKFIIEEQTETKDVITYELPLGVYTITVEDSREISKSITVELGNSLIDVTGYDIVNYRTREHNLNAVKGKDGRFGGYVSFDSIITIDGIECEIVTPDTQMESGRSYVELFYDNGTDSKSMMDGAVESYRDAEGVDKYRFFGTGFTVGEDLTLKMNLQCYYEEHDESGNTIFTGHTTSRETYFITNFTMKDNSNLDLLYGCYYWGYDKLKQMVENRGDEWWNNYPGDSKEDWALKMFMFRQTVNDDIGFNSSVMGYAYDGEKFSTITFGEPERYQSGYKVLKTGFSESDYDAFDGYVLNDTDSRYPTWGIINAGNVYQNSNVSSNSETGRGRIPFSKMTYTSDGRSAADALPDCIVTSVSHDGMTGKNTIRFSGSGLKKDQGAIVVFENGEIVFPFMTSESEGIYYGDEPASNDAAWLKCATVYPTFRFPAMYRPFFGTVKFLTFCFPVVVVNETFDMEAGFTMDFSQKPYFIGGELHNGVTYQNKLSQNSDETVICGYSLEGIYPDGNLTPDNSGTKYMAQPMEGPDWTKNDTTPSPELTTYTSGRTLPVKTMAAYNIHNGGVMEMFGFPYCNIEHTGDTYSYTFTEGYPKELYESANTAEYSGITQPYFPEVKSVSDSVEAVFVDYIVFEANVEEGRSVSRLLYGNTETTEYDDDNGNFLRYYDITDSGMRFKYKSRYSGDEGGKVSKDAWVYTRRETGNKKRPSAAIACVCKDKNMRNAAGSDIVYALVYDPKDNKLMVKYPVINANNSISYDIADLRSRYGQLNGDIMEDLEKNEHGKGLKDVYKLLEDKKLVPLRNPFPDISYGSNGLNYEEFVQYAYNAFLAADANGRQITLSNKKQFLATKPKEVLGVCKQTNGRNETYVFKYYIQVFEFGDASNSTAAHPGEEAVSNVTTDTDSVSVTGSSFNVTINSDYEWILVITSTTKDGITITCPNMGTDSINGSWYVGSDAMTEAKIRSIQKAGTDEEDAALWDVAGGLRFKSGNYVFTIKMNENKSRDDVHINLYSIPYYPYSTDADGNSKTQNTEIVQKARQEIVLNGTIGVSYTREMRSATVNWDFECTSGEWPEEVTLSINIPCRVVYHENSVVNTTERVSITGSSASGGSVTGGGSVNVDASGTISKELAMPITITVSKDRRTGGFYLVDWRDTGSGDLKTASIIDYIGNFKVGSATFTNLGDNYVGKATIICDGNTTTIIQPELND